MLGRVIELLEGAAKRAEAAGRSIIESKDVQRTRCHTDPLMWIQ